MKRNTIGRQEAAIKVRVNGPSVRQISGPVKKPSPRVPEVKDGFDVSLHKKQNRMDTALARPKRRPQASGPKPDGPSTAEVNKELAAAIREQMQMPVAARSNPRMPVASSAPVPREVAQFQEAMGALVGQKTADNRPRRLQRTGVAAADRAVERAMRESAGQGRDYNAVIDRAMELYTDETRGALAARFSPDEIDAYLAR